MASQASRIREGGGQKDVVLWRLNEMQVSFGGPAALEVFLLLAAENGSLRELVQRQWLRRLVAATV